MQKYKYFWICKDYGEDNFSLTGPFFGQHTAEASAKKMEGEQYQIFELDTRNITKAYARVRQLKSANLEDEKVVKKEGRPNFLHRMFGSRKKKNA